ncbi:GGDEF domain-containing protein [Stenotrophomonas sp. MMGLT7]|uniref:GGDEF domain-containing protein n=1 Tax=Stenotrophomonas sp. MMGLT7 TaxID=2901227 RepID=UPI001E61D611|nr:GGDEF domain-containing protein [Stenotrophomonas sp. MMGLT7]MCD7099641.1 GGDEF domain-containing protein [Stenotrophomonas sp. MMGLT7]
MRSELEATLGYVRNLPSPPGVALRVIQLAQDPDADLGSTADVVAMDMALSARMLRIANSPLYASRRRVDNLAQALAMLGLNATLSLALGFSIARAMRNDPDLAREPYERIWRRSVIAAMASRKLGQAKGIRRAEELMLAGLLQDIGALALLQTQPIRYLPLLDQAADHAGLAALERQVLGCTHAEIGGWLAQHWNLPGYLQTAIERSEAGGGDHDDEDTFNACVALSGPVADLWLSEDAEAARIRLLPLIQARLGLDSARFDAVLAGIGESLPEIAAIFDVHIASPSQLEDILDHARELQSLRSLRELQDAAEARRQADESEHRARHLTEQISRDTLTGVFNRHHLESVLEKEFDLALRHDWPLSIAFLDLDDFKRINDAHGHLVGDEVLHAFAQALQKLLRVTDTVARYGGEEFLVLLPGTEEAVAVGVMRRVLTDIAATAMAWPGGTALHVTFSAGVATQGGRERFSSVADLLKAADDVLYSCKHHGRNRVMSRSQPTPGA